MEREQVRDTEMFVIRDIVIELKVTVCSINGSNVLFKKMAKLNLFLKTGVKLNIYLYVC